MASPVEGKALRITDKNVEHDHIPITWVRDLFPTDAFGGGNPASSGAAIEVTLDGVGTFETDISTPHNILRFRSDDSVGRFYKLHNAKHDTRLFFEKIGPRSFRISVID